MENLKKNTTYSYKIGGDGFYKYGIFTTEKESTDKITILNLNNAQTRNPDKLYCWENIANIARNIYKNVDFVAFGGGQIDQLYEQGSPYIDEYLKYGMAIDTVSSIFGSTPYIAACGNHDATPSNLFRLNNYVNYGDSNNAGYYSFDYDYLHFVVLNSFLYTNSIKNLQKEWLEKDLTSANNNNNISWIIVLIHNGLYSTGLNTNSEETKSLIKDYAPIFSSKHVDLVLQARDHTYNKTLPYKWNTIGYSETINNTDIVNLDPNSRLINNIKYDLTLYKEEIKLMDFENKFIDNKLIINDLDKNTNYLLKGTIRYNDIDYIVELAFKTLEEEVKIEQKELTFHNISLNLTYDKEIISIDKITLVSFDKNIIELSKNDYLFEIDNLLGNTNYSYKVEYTNKLNNKNFEIVYDFTTLDNYPFTYEIIDQNADEIKITDIEDIDNIFIPDGINLNNKYYRITKISNNVFDNKQNLKSIYLGKYVNDLNYEYNSGEFTSFANNSLNLNEIRVNKDNAYLKSDNGILYSKNGETLIKCPSNKNIDIIELNDVYKVVKYGLSNITSLKTLIIKSKVIFDDYALYNCINLETVDNFTTYSYFKKYTFAECKSLKAIELNNITGLSEGVFENCISLDYIFIPKTVLKINEKAFNGCLNLSKVIIEPTYTNLMPFQAIQNSAFMKCPNLKTIFIPKTYTNILDDAFIDSKDLTIYTDSESKLSYWSDKAFDPNTKFVFSFNDINSLINGFKRPKVTNDIEKYKEYLETYKDSFVNGYGYLDIENKEKYLCYYNVPLTGPLYQIKYSSVKDMSLMDPYVLIKANVYDKELGNMNNSSDIGTTSQSFTFEFKCYKYFDINNISITYDDSNLEPNTHLMKIYTNEELVIEFYYYTTLDIANDYMINFVKDNIVLITK